MKKIKKILHKVFNIHFYYLFSINVNKPKLAVNKYDVKSFEFEHIKIYKCKYCKISKRKVKKYDISDSLVYIPQDIEKDYREYLEKKWSINEFKKLLDERRNNL